MAWRSRGEMKKCKGLWTSWDARDISLDISLKRRHADSARRQRVRVEGEGEGEGKGKTISRCCSLC